MVGVNLAALLALTLLAPRPVAAQEAPETTEMEELETAQEEASRSPEDLTEEQANLVSKAFWLKANQWVGSRHEKEGRLLMRDLSREFPQTDFGKKATVWLDENRGIDRSGRTEFIIGSTTMGIYFGMAVMMGMMDRIDGLEGDHILWTTVGTGLAGLGGSILASMNTSVSDSQAIIYNFAGLWGFYNGFLVYDLLYPWDEEDAMLAGALGMGLGIGACAATWKNLDVDEGAAQFMVYSGIYTFEILLLADFMIGGEDVLRDNETVALLSLLIPANAASVGGYFLGRHLKWTADDIRLIGLGGLLGNLIGGAIIATVEPDSIETGMGIMLGSVIGSLGISTVLLKPWEDAASGEEGKVADSLLHFGRKGVTVGVPTPQFMPTSYRGETGWGVQLPLLSADL